VKTKRYSVIAINFKSPKILGPVPNKYLFLTQVIDEVSLGLWGHSVR